MTTAFREYRRGSNDMAAKYRRLFCRPKAVYALMGVATEFWVSNAKPANVAQVNFSTLSEFRPTRTCSWRIRPHAAIGVWYKPRQCFCQR